MSQPRKPKRETLMHQAQQLMLADELPVTDLVRIDQELQRVLNPTNPFWIQWSAFLGRLQDQMEKE